MPTVDARFHHLPLPLVEKNRAKLIGRGKRPQREVANKAERTAHANRLRTSAHRVVDNWGSIRAVRETEGLPLLPPNIPILLEIEPGSDLDYLRSAFKFEIVAEHEDGIVIVASESLDLHELLEKIEDFTANKHGSATTAKLYTILDDADRSVRLDRILSKELHDKWSSINSKEIFIVDVSIECLGHVTIPD